MFVAIGISLFVFISAVGSQMNPHWQDDVIISSDYPSGVAIGNIFADIDSESPFKSDQEMKRFSSYSEMIGFLKDVQMYFTKLYAAQSSASDVYFYYGGPSGSARQLSPSFSPSTDFGGLLMASTQEERLLESVTKNSDSQAAIGQANNNEFSGTNIQVSGVDEADFLKTDGKYAYIISSNKLTIIDAYPPEKAKIISKTSLDIAEGQNLQNMYLNGDRIVIFYQDYGKHTVIPQYDYAPQTVYAPSTHAVIIDISSREDPKVLKDYEVDGDYSNSRMYGDKIFLLTFSGVDYQNPVSPAVRESSKIIGTPDVYYFDNPEQSFTFNTITEIDLDLIQNGSNDKVGLLSKTFMIGSGSTVYVSENNIYIAYQQNLPYEYYQMSNKNKFSNVIIPLLPIDVQKQIDSIEKDQSLDSSEKWNKMSNLLQNTYDHLSENEKAQLFSKMQNGIAKYDSAIARDSQNTVVHKISISGNSLLDYVAKGEVPGRLLNQFSMDEHDGRFSIATTSEYSTPQRYVMHNNVYTFDKDMDIVGRLEGIAPDESIYSARFMGDRLYLVTFQRTDPFFVIDLSEDEPKVLGKLKLPGFSNYLHPYDKDHIIGIGRETKESLNGGVEMLGVKIALFDVSDVSDPKAVDTYMIGGPQTDSEVLRDHRAFLFDKEKNVLSIPIFSPEMYSYESDVVRGDVYREPRTWNGFYVFSIDNDERFDLKGQIEHETGANYYYGAQGSRSFYINDTLYTVTPNMIKMNDLGDLDKEVNHLELD